MDIRINLLPAELLGQQKKKRKWREWAAVGSIVLGVFFLVYAVLVILTWQARSEASSVQKTRQSLEVQVTSNEQYALLQTKVAQADKLIGTVLGATSDWAKIMGDISTSMPINIQLTGFSVGKMKNSSAVSSNPIAQFSQLVQGGQSAVVQGQTPSVSAPAAPTSPATSATGTEIDLQGLSADHTSVGEWLEGINKLSYLSDVRCQFSSEEEQDGHKVVRFEIKATLRSANVPAGKVGVSNEH